jgi:hypothetical protein
MRHAASWFAAVALLMSAGAREAIAQNDAAVAPAAQPGIDLSTGWTLLKEGEAEGTMEQDAKHPASESPHLLHIAVIKTAVPGKGRVGAINGNSIDVREGQWCDVVFTAVTERGSIGLVFSLEGADGKVLARTTLPEIGRSGRGRGGGAEAAAAWRKYAVALHPRASDPHAHLVITPIEPTNIWLDDLTLIPRSATH